MKRDKLTPIELQCNMGKDVNGIEHREPWKAYDIDEVDAIIAELESRIPVWHKFSEEKPKHHQDILCYCPRAKVLQGCLETMG